MVEGISIIQQQLAADVSEPLVGAPPAFSLAPSLSALVLTPTPNSIFTAIKHELRKPLDEQDEGYVLQIPGTVSAPPPTEFDLPQLTFDSSSTGTLLANTSLGLLRGLQTFVQLVSSGDSLQGIPLRYIKGVPLSIQDYPSVRFRFANHLEIVARLTCC